MSGALRWSACLLHSKRRVPSSFTGSKADPLPNTAPHRGDAHMPRQQHLEGMRMNAMADFAIYPSCPG